MLNELLELLYTAHQRFSSIQLEWHYWYATEIMQHLMKQPTSEFPAGSFRVLKAKILSEQASSLRKMEIYWRVWWQKPSLWRDEHTIQDSKTIRVIREADKYVFCATKNEMYTNVPIRATHERKQGQLPSLEDVVNEFELLDPSFLLATHSFQKIEKVVYHSRKGLKVKAQYRRGKQVHDIFWSIADEYELIIDQERGILLYYAALWKGKIFAEATVTQVEFDISIPQEVFIIIPPDETRIFLVN